MICRSTREAESTGTSSPLTARQYGSPPDRRTSTRREIWSLRIAHRTSLAKGEVGLRDKKPLMTLGEFCRKRFAPWSESSSSLKTWRDFYRVGIMAIQAYSPLASLTLDTITSERIADFARHRQAQGMKVATVFVAKSKVQKMLQEEMQKLEGPDP